MTKQHPMRVDDDKDVPEGVRGRIVSLRPADNENLVVRLHYRLQEDDQPFLYALSVRPWPELPSTDWQRVGATLIRELPLGAMEQAARYVAALANEPGSFPYPLDPSVPVAEIPGVARDLVRTRFPDLDPDAGAGAARRWRRLIRLAEVTLEHQAAQATGEKNPTAVVATARGVAQSTVRSWLHQAKTEGFEASPAGAFTTIAGHDIEKE